MPTSIIMPKYEMSQETGKIARWLKAEGDVVEKGEPLLEIETDKTNIEVEARAGGVLAGICAEPGQVVPVGQPIAYILKAGETWPPAAAAPAPAAPAPAVAPQESSGVLRATPIAERMAAEHGIDLRAVAATGPGGRITREDVEAHLAVQAAPPSTTDGKVKAVPAARRLARELGVDLSTVTGTGPDGRIQSEDVEQAAAAAQAAPAKVAAAAEQEISPTPPEGLLSPSAPRPAVRRIVPLTNIRRTIAERMTQSVREAPQFTVEVDVDMGRAMTIVQDFRDAAGAAQGPKVTVTALLVKACAWALTQFPAANSMFEADQPSALAPERSAGASVVEWDEVNIGVATAIEQGLIVPVVHNADRLGMVEIAARLTDLTVRARENRLKLDDLQGGTFTISNLGMFGTDRFTAILNPPQAAILAVGRVTKRAMVGADDRIEVRQMASLALTADHRVLDGAAGAQFLALIQRALEHPGLLLG